MIKPRQHPTRANLLSLYERLEGRLDTLKSHLEKETEAWRKLDIETLDVLLKEKAILVKAYLESLEDIKSYESVPDLKKTFPQKLTLKMQEMETLLEDNKAAMQGAGIMHKMIVAVVKDQLIKAEKGHVHAYTHYGLLAPTHRVKKELTLNMDVYL